MTDLLFKPFEHMTTADYASVGFKSGLEIHQQLLTSRKLFCRCPAGKYSDRYHAEILRHMRPTLSELGVYDGTALMEFKTKKEIIYQIHRETVCTYEMDDTPPFEINDEALDIALGIGMMFQCAAVDELHIARKQYLDGSIPTGFQRTAIFGLNGRIPYKGRDVGVVQMSIEEDSCREVSDAGHRRVYLTDRLGMPLIETVTAPDMRTPFEVAEVADLCRRMTRSTGRVRTGIGSARQDVNVSVTGGTRIEIKGVPRIPRIPLLTYNEARRQWNLLRLRDELHRRGITGETFRSSVETVTRLVRKTMYTPVRDAVASGLDVNCVVLRGFRGLLRWETQTDTMFSREISDRVRVIACLTTLPNIIHSDNPSESLATSEWQAVKKLANASDDDTMVLVWGDRDDAATGASEIAIRAREAAIGIPSETRQALRDGTNGFERILPGADRMYPDTDLPPRRITEERLERIRVMLPSEYWSRESAYRALGVPEDLLRPLAISPHALLFEELTRTSGVSPVFASVVIVRMVKELRRAGHATGALTTDVFRSVLIAHASGRLAKEGVVHVLKEVCRAGRFDEQFMPAPCTEAESRAAVTSALAQLVGVTIRQPDRRRDLVMGMVMPELRGRVDGTRVARFVAEGLGS